MTDYKNLVEALRHCSEADDACATCQRWLANDEWGIKCKGRLISDAAAAIESLNRLLDQNTQRCEALRKQLREAHENYEKHLNELEAQLPKRGEWKTTDAFPHRVYCSRCFRTYVPNDRWQIWVDKPGEGGLERNYCPSCGAKMEVQE